MLRHGLLKAAPVGLRKDVRGSGAMLGFHRGEILHVKCGVPGMLFTAAEENSSDLEPTFGNGFQSLAGVESQTTQQIEWEPDGKGAGGRHPHIARRVHREGGVQSKIQCVARYPSSTVSRGGKIETYGPSVFHVRALIHPALAR